ncbi:hypothetical protein EU642_22225 [Salmonella enterica]|nr:hypothetical protein [Salmonella enterica]EAO0118572.1 hypothetical protein [Salmonella enterica]EAO3601675.1 hypothetical protein [Salmonella enterica]EAR6391570.1 hypothetical protein [Salmonella enterica]EAV1285334.1 hypothetical protein [Salmonella enterica]
MAYAISFLSGKGGVTKTSLARAVTVKFRCDDWEVGVLDIDTAQASFRNWNDRRKKFGHTPAIDVISGTPNDLHDLKAAERHHLIVVDGAAYGSVDSVNVAQQSDMIVVSCRFSIDDMQSAVETMNSLVLKGIPKERFCVVFSGVPEQRSPVNYARAQAYMGKTPYYVVPGFIEQMNSITDAQNEGLAMNEIRYRTLRDKVDMVMDGIVARLEALTGE